MLFSKHSLRCALSCALLATTLAFSATTRAQEEQTETASKLRPWTLRVHYARPAGDYAGWGVYAWKGPQNGAPKWPANWKFTGHDHHGVYLDIVLGESAATVEFLISDGKGNKNCAQDQKYTLPASIAREGREIWLRQGSCSIASTPHHR